MPMISHPREIRAPTHADPMRPAEPVISAFTRPLSRLSELRPLSRLQFAGVSHTRSETQREYVAITGPRQGCNGVANIGHRVLRPRRHAVQLLQRAASSPTRRRPRGPFRKSVAAGATWPRSVITTRAIDSASSLAHPVSEIYRRHVSLLLDGPGDRRSRSTSVLGTQSGSPRHLFTCSDVAWHVSSPGTRAAAAWHIGSDSRCTNWRPVHTGTCGQEIPQLLSVTSSSTARGRLSSAVVRILGAGTWKD
jgi:hypothetical protein